MVLFFYGNYGDTVRFRALLHHDQHGMRLTEKISTMEAGEAVKIDNAWEKEKENMANISRKKNEVRKSYVTTVKKNHTPVMAERSGADDMLDLAALIKPANILDEDQLEEQLLTQRQQETLRLLAQGMSNKQIAQQLKISVKTVDAHRASIMTRLRIHNLAGLVKYAIRTGLTSID